ncbi:MAG: glycoside hydrolase family 3 N-terminal domain-containing protein, partial [Micropruina sp.]
QRLQGPGFERIPSARDQARLTDAELTRRATRWGQQLRRAGVRYNLAPVADVVPAAWAGRNDPIGALGRGYGADPARVSAKVEAVRQGLEDAGVAASVKHFPGIGQVRGNTDFAASVVDRDTTADDLLLKPFREAARTGVDSIMVSTVVYRRIDPARPAVFSPTVIDILRSDFGYDGVVISDDLGAAASMRTVPARLRALRFVRAGGDLTINAEPRLTAAMAEGLTTAAATDPALGERIAESAGRVLALKARLGLMECAD